MKDENEPSMKVFLEAMIQSCVEVAVRETKRENAEFSGAAEQNTTVSIADDISLLNWIHQLDSSFRSAIFEQTENWSRMEEANGAIWREDGFEKTDTE